MPLPGRFSPCPACHALPIDSFDTAGRPGERTSGSRALAAPRTQLEALPAGASRRALTKLSPYELLDEATFAPGGRRRRHPFALAAAALATLGVVYAGFVLLNDDDASVDTPVTVFGTVQPDGPAQTTAPQVAQNAAPTVVAAPKPAAAVAQPARPVVAARQQAEPAHSAPVAPPAPPVVATAPTVARPAVVATASSVVPPPVVATSRTAAPPIVVANAPSVAPPPAIATAHTVAPPTIVANAPAVAPPPVAAPAHSVAPPAVAGTTHSVAPPTVDATVHTVAPPTVVANAHTLTPPPAAAPAHSVAAPTVVANTHTVAPPPAATTTHAVTPPPVAATAHTVTPPPVATTAPTFAPPPVIATVRTTAPQPVVATAHTVAPTTPPSAAVSAPTPRGTVVASTNTNTNLNTDTTTAPLTQADKLRADAERNLKAAHGYLQRGNLAATRARLAAVITAQPDNRDARRMRAEVSTLEQQRDALLSLARGCGNVGHWDCASHNANEALQIDSSSKAARRLVTLASHETAWQTVEPSEPIPGDMRALLGHH
ncbi:hypothetical protein CI15_03075 [Paraburkholderia monticola]|uniref:Uncharacterized protein n=1 Tax=Paraburkholderia monticola TaxID=1399968 RepID=A0A149Q0X3_9BURK|nr:hypothetical protein CI15_03075 [Paraburkholderia monticola]